MAFNPFTGAPRHPDDIASDPAGLLVWDGEEPLRPAAPAQAVPMPMQAVGNGLNPYYEGNFDGESDELASLRRRLAKERDAALSVAAQPLVGALTDEQIALLIGDLVAATLAEEREEGNDAELNRAADRFIAAKARLEQALRSNGIAPKAAQQEKTDE
jgi:hypothetical protein